MEREKEREKERVLHLDRWIDSIRSINFYAL